MLFRKKEKPKEMIYDDWGHVIVGNQTHHIYLLTFDEALICYDQNGKKLWTIDETNVAGYPDYQLCLSPDEHYLVIYERFSSELFVIDLSKHQQVISYDFSGFDIDFGYFAYRDVFQIISAPNKQMISLSLKNYSQTTVSMASIDVGDCFIYDSKEAVLHVINYQKHDTYTRDGALRSKTKPEDWKLFFNQDRIMIHQNILYSFDVSDDRLYAIDCVTNSFTFIKLEKKRWDYRFNKDDSHLAVLSTKGHYILIQRENNLLDVYDTTHLNLCLSVGAEHPMRTKCVTLEAHKRAIDYAIYVDQTQKLLILTMEGLFLYNLSVH